MRRWKGGSVFILFSGFYFVRELLVAAVGARGSGFGFGSGGIGIGRGLDVIEDARAGFALEDVVGVAAQFLKHVRANDYAAQRAGFVANFGDGDAAVMLGDVLVQA